VIKISYSGTVLIEATEPTPPLPLQAGVWITTNCGGIKIKSKGPYMAYTLPNDKQVTVQVTYEDAKGNPATVDGEVTWASSDEDIATVEVDDTDSTKAVITPGDTLGNSQITATADADLGAGVREIICTMDLTTVAGEAVVGRISPLEATQLPS
jgi:uncharacterized protein YjdB